MLDLAIVGATVVTPTGPALLDIGVRRGHEQRCHALDGLALSRPRKATMRMS